MTKSGIKVEYANRPDGNDRPDYGYYVTHYGVPVGRSYRTRREAKQVMLEYIADLYKSLDISKV